MLLVNDGDIHKISTHMSMCDRERCEERIPLFLLARSGQNIYELY
jgi:hypothetical protein